MMASLKARRTSGVQKEPEGGGQSMGKRSTRFYRKNEAEVMNALGLKPTKVVMLNEKVWKVLS